MTNKRKQRIRSVAEATDTSHAEAANLLNQAGPQVKRWAGPIEALFVEDLIHHIEPKTTPVGGFVRVDPYLPFYVLEEGGAFVIGEEGNNILKVWKPKNVIVPRYEVTCEVTYGVQTVERGEAQIQATVREHMSALLDAAYVDGFDTPEWQGHPVPRNKLMSWFRNAFKGRTGTVHLFEQNGNCFGILGYAGILVTEGPSMLIGGSDGFKMLVKRMGLAVFSDRVRAVKIVEPT